MTVNIKTLNQDQSAIITNFKAYGKQRAEDLKSIELATKIILDNPNSDGTFSLRNKKTGNYADFFKRFEEICQTTTEMQMVIKEVGDDVKKKIDTKLANDLWMKINAIAPSVFQAANKLGLLPPEPTPEEPVKKPSGSLTKKVVKVVLSVGAIATAAYFGWGYITKALEMLTLAIGNAEGNEGENQQNAE